MSNPIRGGGGRGSVHCFIPFAELVWKVARYTSAAPMYFTEFENYVDGGVLANNPCDEGLIRIQGHFRQLGVRTFVSCVVSVGCGVYPINETVQPSCGVTRSAVTRSAVLYSTNGKNSGYEHLTVSLKPCSSTT